MVFSRPGGRGSASQDAGWFIAAPSRRDDSRPLPGPPIVPHPRKRLAASATGGAAPLSPIFSFWMRQKATGAPTKSADFVGRGGAKERSGVLAEGGDGVEWISPRRRAVHGPKEKNRLRLNIRGIPIRGRADSHRAVLLIYLPATGTLYCFAAGDVGVVHLSHEFLGHLWKPRLLLVPRLSSFVSRRISLVSSSFVSPQGNPRPPSFVPPPAGRGNAQGGTAVPS